MEKISGLSKKYDIPIAVFGHLGDGNLHVNFLVSLPAQENIFEDAVKELFQQTIEHGGTLSGEHGIGLAKMDYISMALPEKEIALMRKLKNLFDPNTILNPGKMF